MAGRSRHCTVKFPPLLSELKSNFLIYKSSNLFFIFCFCSKRSESKAKESMSYSEDFEDEKSIPLTQSAAYQKMLSTVDVSDEGEDLEEDFLGGII